MVEANVSLPLCTRSALVSLHVGTLLDSAEHDPIKVAYLVAHSKPWVGPKGVAEFSPLRRTTWGLCALSDLGDQARFDWFVDTIFNNFLIPMIAKGQGKAAHLRHCCLRLTAAWDADSEDLELSDFAYQIMAESLTCWRCIDAIAGASLDILEGNVWLDLADLRAKASSSSGSLDVRVAIAIDDSAWYKERLAWLLEASPRIKKHSEDIKMDMALVAETPDTFSETNAGAASEFLQRFCVYKSDLPEELLAAYQSSLLLKTSNLLNTGLEYIAKEIDPPAVVALRGLSSEASLPFSLDEHISELVASINNKMAGITVETLQVQAHKLLRDIGKDDINDEDLQKAAEQLDMFAGANFGFVLKPDSHSLFAAACTMLAQKAPSC